MSDQRDRVDDRLQSLFISAMTLKQEELMDLCVKLTEELGRGKESVRDRLRGVLYDIRLVTALIANSKELTLKES
jgi:hypothetical protein